MYSGTYALWSPHAQFATLDMQVAMALVAFFVIIRKSVYVCLGVLGRASGLVLNALPRVEVAS